MLREILHEYHSVCLEATKRFFEGHVAQYLGDGVLVYFGYSLAHEDDAERAVRAGLEIQRALANSDASSRSFPTERAMCKKMRRLGMD